MFLGPPSKPDVVDWSESFAELKWKAGDGSEPTSYKVCFYMVLVLCDKQLT